MKALNQKNKRDIGNQYESLARVFLARQGLRFISANYHSRFGELDLIMQDQATIVFIEVKYRTNTNFGHANEMVSYSKQQKLIKTAMIWLKHHGYNIDRTNFRFDIVAIEKKGDDINWIKNAITQG